MKIITRVRIETPERRQIICFLIGFMIVLSLRKRVCHHSSNFVSLFLFVSAGSRKVSLQRPRQHGNTVIVPIDPCSLPASSVACRSKTQQSYR